MICDSIILHTKKSRNSNVVPFKVPKPECIAHLKLKPDELGTGKILGIAGQAYGTKKANLYL